MLCPTNFHLLRIVDAVDGFNPALAATFPILINGSLFLKSGFHERGTQRSFFAIMKFSFSFDILIVSLVILIVLD